MNQTRDLKHTSFLAYRDGIEVPYQRKAKKRYNMQLKSAFRICKYEAPN